LTQQQTNEIREPIQADVLGDRLRVARQAYGISLRELARRVGVSASLISQIETGKIHPSVSTLYSLASELGASVDELLFEDAFPTRSAPDPWSQAALNHPPVAPVQRAQDRRSIELGSGVRWERLTTDSVPGMDFLYVVYEPGAESSPHAAMQRHSGREWAYVVSGVLHVTIAFNQYVLGPGDSLAFDSTVPHRFDNPGTTPVEAIFFVLGRHSGYPSDSTAE